MAGTAKLRIEGRQSESGPARATLVLEDGRYSGREATLSMRTQVDVTRSGGVDANEQRTLLQFRIAGRETPLELPAEACERFGYSGDSITIASTIRVQVEGETVLEGSVDDFRDVRVGRRPQGENAAELIEPSDKFSILDNLRALPPQNRLKAVAIMLVGSLFIAVNSFVGVHDQFVPESRTWFYDHRGSDGSESPVEKSLFGSGAAAAALWVALRAQLRRYMSIALVAGFATPRRGTRIDARQLLRGKARVALEQVRVRVVAANRELGKYTERSGTRTRTVTFQNPVHAVVLYDTFLPHVPAHAPIESYLSGEVDFAQMFASLYPPLRVGSEHGIDLVWEAQLLHPKFVDQEVMGPVDGLRFADFLDG